MMNIIDNDEPLKILLDSIFNELDETDFVILKAVSLKQFESVLDLNLSDQLLMSIETKAFEQLTLLESLDLSKNLIVQLNGTLFAHNIHLKQLNLSRNNLRLFHGQLIFNSSEILDVDFSHNSLTILDENFIRSKTLTGLNLSHNKIGRVHFYAFMGVGNLKCLNLAANKMEWLKIVVKQLETVNLNDNRLGLLEFGSPTLKTVRARNNFVQERLKCGILKNQWLTELDLSTDSCNGIDFILQGTFDSVRLLKILKLKVKEFFSFASLEILSLLIEFQLVFVGRHRFEIKNKSISDFFATKLNFESLTIVCMQFFEDYLTRIGQLVNLKHVHFECLEPNYVNFKLNVCDLFFQNEKIETIVLKNLNCMMLTKCFRTNINDSLKVLNHVSKLSVIGIGNFTIYTYFSLFRLIQYLDLSDGNFIEIHEKALKHLKFLRFLFLNNCKLMCISLVTFENNRQLQTLSLNNNCIKEIADLAFFQLDHLEFLDLRNNPIEKLTKFTFYNLQLTKTNVYFDDHIVKRICSRVVL